VAQEAARGQVVAVAQDLVRVAAVEAAAVQERDQGQAPERDRAPVQVQEAVPVQDRAMVPALAAVRGQAADTDLARGLDREQAGSLAMAFAFTSGMTSSKSGPSSMRLAP